MSLFEDRFGRLPAATRFVPGRVNLIGEHTDYNEGFVLPASIDRVATCAFRQNGMHVHRLAALDRNEQIEVASTQALQAHEQQWANYLLGVLAELTSRGHTLPGIDCAMTCNVPQGAGLSSSAAIAIAFVSGLNTLFDLGLSRWERVLVGQAAENKFVGAQTGFLDQFASVFGERGKALLLDCRHRTHQAYPIHLPDHELVVLDTGVQHNHATSGYARRRATCESAVVKLQQAGWPGESLRDASLDDLRQHPGLLTDRELQRARFIIEENARVLRSAAQLAEGDVTGFGESLLAGHWGLSELYEVSCPESDAVVRFGEEHAACKGARQMGGGFGGCVLCVVEQEAVTDFVDEAQQFYFDRYAIALERLDLQLGRGAWVEGVAEPLAEEGEQDRTVDLDLAQRAHRRLNILTGSWVLVSPHRAQRPWQGKLENPSKADQSSYEEDCYLCPGNVRASGQRNPNYQGVYAFDNDFAALTAAAGETSVQDGLLVAEAERGVCRVLCYAPDHSKTLATLSDAQRVAVVQLWQQQYAELGALDYVNHVQVFENKGELMGCSNPHPHGQVWAQATVPEVAVRKGQHQLDYFEATEGQHLLSAYLEQEVAANERVLYADAHVLAVVPWWAVWPFEVLVAPRRPQAHIALLDEEELVAFAHALGVVTQRYDALFGVSFPYSMGIHQAPTDGADHQHWHWHLEFKPPLLRSASVKKHMVGYEMFAEPQRDMTPEVAIGKLLGRE